MTIFFQIIIIIIGLSPQLALAKALSATAANAKPPLFEVKASAQISEITFSADEKLTAFGSEDGLIKVIDLATQKEIFQVKTPKPAYLIKLSFSNQYLAAAYEDSTDSDYSTISIYSLDTQQELFKIPHIRGYLDTSFAFTPDDKRIIAASHYDTKIYDLATKKSVFEILKDSPDIQTRISASVQHIITFPNPYTADIFDLKTLKKLFTLNCQVDSNGVAEPTFATVDFAEDGQSIVALIDYPVIKGPDAVSHQIYQKIYSLNSGNEIYQKYGEIYLSPNGALFADLGPESTIDILSTATQKIILQIERPYEFEKLEFSRNGLYMLVQSNHRDVQIYDLKTKKLLPLRFSEFVLFGDSNFVESGELLNHNGHIFNIKSMQEVIDTHALKHHLNIFSSTGQYLINWERLDNSASVFQLKK